MGKRFILAIILSMAVIMVYSYIYGPQKEYPSPPVEERPAYKAETMGLAKPMEKEKGVEEKVSVVVALPEGASEVIVDTDLFRIVFTTSGARVKSFRLKRHMEVEISLKGVEGLEERAEVINKLKEALEDAKRRGQIGEAREILDQLALEEGVELVSLEAEQNRDYPLTLGLQDEELSRRLNVAIYEPDKARVCSLNKEATLTFTSPLIEGVKVEKRFTFWPNSYTVGLDLMIGDERGRIPKEGWFLLEYGPELGLPEPPAMRRYGYRGPVTLIGMDVIKEKYSRDELERYIERVHSGEVAWTAIEDKYFICALIPQEKVDAAIVAKDEAGSQRVALRTPLVGKDLYRFKLYLGPKEEERLKGLGVGLEKTIEYGFFAPIAKAIYVVLKFFYGWTHNYGWAIILLSLTIKAVFYPMTHRSFEAMQKMQEDMKGLQPELDELKQKCGDNPRKLQKEQMELYKRRGVNPMAGCRGGCLPMLLQLPVFFALYVVLYNSIELRNAGFLWWIKDLSSKDPYYIIPILMGVSMLVQQKLTGMGGGGQQQQAKMMMWMMPILFTWIFARLPSGIVLYWFAFNVVTSIEQILIKRKAHA